MARVDCLQRITTYNSGRDPERLRRKYAAMRADAFAFLRGTCHLFYEDWPHTSPLNEAPRTWICGDLHLGRFSEYDKSRVCPKLSSVELPAWVRPHCRVGKLGVRSKMQHVTGCCGSSKQPTETWNYFASSLTAVSFRSAAFE